MALAAEPDQGADAPPQRRFGRCRPDPVPAPASRVPCRVPPAPRRASGSSDTASRSTAGTVAQVGDKKAVPAVEQIGKSTRLNSSHLVISYAVFCLKKKKP